MKNSYILIIAMTLSLIGCKEVSKKNNEDTLTKQPKTDVEKPLNNDEISKKIIASNGTYTGLLPCASCPGIVSTVFLKKDGTFEKNDLYLDSKDGYFTEKGTFSFTKKNNVILKTATESMSYALEENTLTLLGIDGEKSSSAVSEMYKLTKMSTDEVNFSTEPVKGLLIFGHEVASFQPCGSVKTYWINDVTNGDLTKIYNQKTSQKQTAYTPVIAELILKNTQKTAEGFAEAYHGILEVLEIKSVENISPENYCN
ncbi:copper resistance protein NlpE [Tenacibaculum piscium]|uniref:copper resistance protein NlpE n=1 Tax=Tenacibaculum piscium TaxID=1458515 RepID=UPI001F36E058|nr:copper resistance protein NlpE [Tenacibaculum piscium]